MTKELTKETIFRINIEYYSNRLTKIEIKWLQEHVVLEPDRVIIYKDSSYEDWENFINALSTKIGIY